MSQPRINSEQTDEPDRSIPVLPCCFRCGRPGAGGNTRLGGYTAGGGTRVPICTEGTGCNDGRIYHGPPATEGPHLPDEECAACVADRQRERRNGITRRTGNRSSWHR